MWRDKLSWCCPRLYLVIVDFDLLRSKNGAVIAISRSELLDEDWTTHIPTSANWIQNTNSEYELFNLYPMTLICWLRWLYHMLRLLFASVCTCTIRQSPFVICYTSRGYYKDNHFKEWSYFLMQSIGTGTFCWQRIVLVYWKV